MPLLRRNYSNDYLADIGAQGTNGRLVKRGGALMRQAEFSVNVHSESFAPGNIPIPTFVAGTDQYGRETRTPGPWSVWSPFSGRIVENQPLTPSALRYPASAWTASDSNHNSGITLASWDCDIPFDGTYGQHDQIGATFHFTERLLSVCQPRYVGANNGPPQSVPDWFWAAKVAGTLEFSYAYRYAGGRMDDGQYYDTERGRYAPTFGYTADDGDDGVINWSAWIFGPREQHRIRGTGLEIYGSMADFSCDLVLNGNYPSEVQGAALLDTWLRNEVAGIYLQLTTDNAHAA